MKRIQLLLISIHLLIFSNITFSQTAYIDTKTTQEGTLKWKYTVKDFISIPPLMAPDGTIYLSKTYLTESPLGMVTRHKLFAINSEGLLKWEHNLKYYLYDILAIDTDGLIYFTGYDIGGHDSSRHDLYSLYPDGNQNINFHSPGLVDYGALGDDKYFTNTYGYPNLYFNILKPDGTLIELDIKAGQPFIGTNGFVYFNGSEGIKRLISSENIEIISSRDSIGYHSNLLAIGKENTLYIGGNTFRALKPDGTLLWDYPLIEVFNCAIDKEGVVYSSNNSIYDDYLYAINPDGTLKWRYREEKTKFKQKIKSPCIGSDGVIYFIDFIFNETYVYALNPDGTFRWRFHIATFTTFIPDNFYLMLHKNGLLYVADSAGTLYAIQTSSYGYQTGSPWPCYGHDNGHTFIAGIVYTSVEKETQQNNTPDNFSLIRNYPNPFNSSTTISFNINRPGKVEISVYNLQGQKISVLNKSYFQNGYHSIVWDAGGFSSGLYFIKMKFESKYSTLRAMLVK